MIEAAENFSTPTVKQIFELLQEKLLSAGIVLEESSHNLLRAAIEAQLREGIMPNEAQFLTIVSKSNFEFAALFCKYKLGTLSLNFVDLLTLMANMHDRWLLARSS